LLRTETQKDAKPKGKCRGWRLSTPKVRLDHVNAQCTLSIVLYWKVAAQEHEMNGKDQNKIDPFSTSALFFLSKSSNNFVGVNLLLEESFVFSRFHHKNTQVKKILKLKTEKVRGETKKHKFRHTFFQIQNGGKIRQCYLIDGELIKRKRRHLMWSVM